MNRIVYLHGFASSPKSKKALFFAARFAERGITLEIPDLAADDFEHLTITGQMQVIEQTCRDEPVTLIGSSMGGYLAALYASRRPSVVKLVLMAPAFGFLRRWPETFGQQRLEVWKRTGFLPVYHYGEGTHRNLSYDIIADGEQYPDFPGFRQSALIFHGTDDSTVPAEVSQTFSNTHANARLILLQSGHELVDQLDPIWDATSAFLELD